MEHPAFLIALKGREGSRQQDGEVSGLLICLKSRIIQKPFKPFRTSDLNIRLFNLLRDPDTIFHPLIKSRSHDSQSVWSEPKNI